MLLPSMRNPQSCHCTAEHHSGTSGWVPAELYRNLPELARPCCELCERARAGRNVPEHSCSRFRVPLDKSRRPIPLICVLIKVLAALVYRRMPARFETKQHVRQFAYREGIGEEFHLTELADFVREAHANGENICIMTIGVKAVLDLVPHECVTRTLKKRGIETYFLRFLVK